MTNRLLILPFLVLALSGCGRRDKFAMAQDLRGVVEIASWPKIPPGVYGFNLYMAKEQNGDFEKITDQPATGGKVMIPYLDHGREYWFKLSYVMKDGRESKPGGAWKRRSSAAPK